MTTIKSKVGILDPILQVWVKSCLVVSKCGSSVLSYTGRRDVLYTAKQTLQTLTQNRLNDYSYNIRWRHGGRKISNMVLSNGVLWHLVLSFLPQWCSFWNTVFWYAVPSQSGTVHISTKELFNVGALSNNFVSNRKSL